MQIDTCGNEGRIVQCIQCSAYLGHDNGEDLCRPMTGHWVQNASV